MVQAPITEHVPLATDEQGAIRVSGTRVTLDTVVLEYRAGKSAEYIAEGYPVPLADVHQIIAYYLRHKDEVEEYLQKRRGQGEELRKIMEKRFPPGGIRQRLLSRRRQDQA